MRYALILLTTCLFFQLPAEKAIENSIISFVEKYENVENLPREKFSINQYEEILKVLQQKENRIRLVTYNILFNIKDHKMEENYRWPQRLSRVVKMIEEIQPDVLGVQELYLDQLQDLLPFIEGTYSFYSREEKNGELNGIFYRTDRFDVIENRVWHDTLTMLHLQDRKTGKQFAVFNTHLNFSDVEKRECEARFIAKQIEAYAAVVPVIFTGDLNTFSSRLDMETLPFYDGDYILRILTEKSLQEAKKMSLLGHLGPIGTFTNSPENGVPFKGTGTPGIFLDHILVSKGLSVLIHAVQPGTVGGYFPSDHMPVLIDFVVDPTK